MKRIYLGLAIISVAGRVVLADAIDVERYLKEVRSVGPKGEGHPAAMVAVRQLSQVQANQLPRILAAMDGADKLATNWLRAVVETVAQRTMTGGGTLPAQQLEAFVTNTSHSPHARRLAYELIRDADPSIQQRLIPGMLDDPSLELRRDAVDIALQGAEAHLERDKAKGVAALHVVLSAARDLDQIEDISNRLRKLGETVDLPAHFGFLMRWRLVGPFDNSDKRGFDTAYEPEKKLNLMDQYSGKHGATIRWFDATTDDPYGTVDLNTIVGKHMGAVVYAYAEFFSSREQEVELRLGCINANKVWLNGQLVTANDVYHSNTNIDQYIGKGGVKKGKNIILLKVCQNEQTESWAQRWQFQLRVCDQYGTAILSIDRQRASTAAHNRIRR